MEKLLVFVLVFVGFFAFASLNVDAATMPEDQPTLGEENPETDFYSHWQPSIFGSERLGDTKIAMATTSGFGMRAGFRTPYDITDFEVSLDLSYIDPGVAVITFFGAQGSYIGGNGATLSMEIIKHTTEANKYLVAIQKGTGTHNVGFSETVVAEQGDWEDSAWVGYHVVAADDVINIALKDEGANSTISINDTDFTIATDKLYADVPDKTSTYYSVGTVNMDGSIQTLIANYVFDAERRTYYGTEGTYQDFVTKLNNLETALEEDLTVIENVEAAQAIRDTMDESLLYEWDQAYLDERYEAAYDTLDTAVTELGGDIVINAFETELVKYEDKVDAVIDYDSAMDALDLEDKATIKYNDIDQGTLTPEQVTRLDALKNRFDDAQALLDTNIEIVITNQANEFVDAVQDLSTIEKVNEALVKLDAINSDLFDIVSDDLETTLTGQINTAEQTLNDATSDEGEDWNAIGETYVLDKDSTMSTTFLGSGLSSNNGIFYTNEKLDIRNFSMTLDFNSFTTETGGWLSFGFMENPQIFSAADDSSVQDNKGFFFLIIPEGDTARVEIYHLSLYSNRFFDAQIQETLTIDITQPVEIEFATEIIDVSGVKDEYMSISIGGEKMESEMLTVQQMKTSLEDHHGYLYLAAEGSSVEKMVSINISEINGVSPFADNLYAEYIGLPMSTDSSIEYEKESGDVVSFDFDAGGEEIDSITIGETELQSTDYTYEENTITLENSYLDGLEAGEKSVEVTTAGGTVTLSLTLNEVTPEVPEETGLSTGAIIGIVAGAVVLLAGGVSAVVMFGKKG